MKISIVTPSFNQGRFLDQTIRSVIEQDYPDMEYLVVDGGSTDNSVDIIRTHEKQIDWWVSEEDKGQSDAINKGLKRATGDIVAWINSDDYYEPEVFQLVARSFEENPDADLIYFDVRNFSNSTSEVFRHQACYPPELFCTKVCLHQPGVFWRKNIMDKVGYLNESLYYTMDFDFWLKIYSAGRIQYVPRVATNFRIHSDSKTHSDPIALYIEKNAVIKNFFDNAPSSRTFRVN